MNSVNEARVLPRTTIDGEQWFIDRRLKELRQVDNPHVRMDLADWEQERVPRYSPWGTIDHSEMLADGIYQVSTPSHGGIWLSRQRLSEMPEKFKAFQSRYGDIANGFYEEDCDWVVPVLAFAEEMPFDMVSHASLAAITRPEYYGFKV